MARKRTRFYMVHNYKHWYGLRRYRHGYTYAMLDTSVEPPQLVRDPKIPEHAILVQVTANEAPESVTSSKLVPFIS